MKTAAYILLGLMVSLLLGFFIVPIDLTTERLMYIEAKPAEVYPHLVDVSRWDAWESWQTEPIGDTTVGVGAMRSWPDGGVLKIDNAERDIRLHYTVEQLSREESGNIEINPHQTKDGTVVVWTHFSQTGYSPGARLAGWSKRSAFALKLDEALVGLKDTVEGKGK